MYELSSAFDTVPIFGNWILTVLEMLSGNMVGLSLAWLISAGICLEPDLGAKLETFCGVFIGAGETGGTGEEAKMELGLKDDLVAAREPPERDVRLLLEEVL